MINSSLKIVRYITKSIKSDSMDNLRIFLGDLTYDTVAISTEAMPLNVGYVASYC